MKKITGMELKLDQNQKKVKDWFLLLRNNLITTLEKIDGGTLFLDELSDLSLENQKDLLRFVEDGKIKLRAH